MTRLLAWLAVLVLPSAGEAGERLVRTQAQYEGAARGATAGDTIVLADGEWRDFELVVSGQGTATRPITVRSQTAGRVILTGQSSLRIGGRHIVVRGLVFRDGFSPRGEVIAFRRDADDVASDSRVTEVVIDHFSKPGRYDDDYWVSLYGRGNRFDHNHLVGKTNMGVTLAVRLDGEESRENGHRIDHNYFGPRQALGSNGGETIRIGTSQYSMFRSGTLVEGNVFDRCDGEVEIVSIKSNGNTVRGNTFLRSRGGLALRHGDGTVVERNVFLGGRKDYTGGVRVINRDQVVRGNYMEGLRGTGFGSALTVMNGVPNSPVTRYVQVDNALIEGNTVVDSARVTLAAGADAERSAPPVNSVVRRNLFVATGSAPLFAVEDDVSGIRFDGDVLSQTATGGPDLPLTRRAVTMARADNGLLYPTDPALAGVGAPRDLIPVPLSEVGVAWYAKSAKPAGFAVAGRTRTVAPGDDALALAVEAAGEGDVLVLAPGHYLVDRVIGLDKTLTLRGADRATTIIRFTRPALIELRQGGNLRISDLTVDGSLAPDAVGNSVVRTTAFPIQDNLLIELTNVAVNDLTVNKSFNVVTLGKGVLADRVTIRDSDFARISGAVVAADTERDDFGRYNVEYLDVTNSRLTDVTGPLASVYRGGTDESTFGPSVTLTGNTLTNVGGGASGASVLLHGVQTARIADNAFSTSAPIRIVHTVGTPDTAVVENTFSQTPVPTVVELVHKGDARAELRGNTVEGRPTP